MNIQEFLKEEKCFKHLKWVEVIQQENLAVKPDSMYIIEKDKVWCDVIFIDSNGNKRKIGGASYEQIREKFALLDLSNLSEEKKIIWKETLGGLSAYEIAVESGEFIGTVEQWLEFLKGKNGEDGEDGITPEISIGNVITLNPDQEASVTETGTISNPIFNFGIPKGEKGDDAEISVISFDAELQKLIKLSKGLGIRCLLNCC